MTRRTFAMRLLAAALGAALVTLVRPAEACESVAVEVLPFDPPVEYRPFADLTRLAGGLPTFGAVVSKMTVRAEGCAVTAGWTDARIILAAELREDPCAHEHVLHHEREHARIYREALAALPERVRNRPADQRPFDAAIEALDASKPHHVALDSPDEYRRNLTACGGAIVRVTRLREWLAARRASAAE